MYNVHICITLWYEPHTAAKIEQIFFMWFCCALQNSSSITGKFNQAQILFATHSKDTLLSTHNLNAYFFICESLEMNIIFGPFICVEILGISAWLTF